MVILLFSPFITSKLMSESGVTQVAENLGQMAGMATLIGGATIASKYVGAKAVSALSSIHNSATKPILNSVKSNLSNKALGISKSKGFSQTITNHSPLDKLKGKLADTKEVMNNTSFKEKSDLRC